MRRFLNTNPTKLEDKDLDAVAVKGRPPRRLLVCALEGGQSGEREFFERAL